MPLTAQKNRPDRSEFVFVGDHPAVDFANTLVLSEGHRADLFRDWADVVGWLSQAGLSTASPLQLPARRGTDALKSVVDLRQRWAREMDKLIAGERVGDPFIKKINHLLAGNFSHEILHRSAKTGFHLEPSVSRLTGEKLALALLARHIAHFLTGANPAYLRRCANTASCVLYFYDTTKNHRRQWCSAATCGNRHKVAQFRRRQAQAA